MSYCAEVTLIQILWSLFCCRLRRFEFHAFRHDGCYEPANSLRPGTRSMSSSFFFFSKRAQEDYLCIWIAKKLRAQQTPFRRTLDECQICRPRNLLILAGQGKSSSHWPARTRGALGRRRSRPTRSTASWPRPGGISGCSNITTASPALPATTWSWTTPPGQWELSALCLLTFVTVVVSSVTVILAVLFCFCLDMVMWWLRWSAV